MKTKYTNQWLILWTMKDKSRYRWWKWTFWIIIQGCVFAGVRASERKPDVWEYCFRSLTIDNGLPHSDANVVVQDKSGFIWIGTYAGLACYDGYTVTTYYNQSNGINNAYANRIFDISVDDDGLLWIATSIGIQLFDPVNKKYIPISIDRNQIAESEYELEKILTFRGSYILVKTNTNRLIMYRVYPNFRLERTNLNLNTQCHSLWKDMFGNIWLGTDQGCFVLNDQESLLQLSIPEAIEKQDGKSVYFSFVDSEQCLWIATRKHLYIHSKFRLPVGGEKRKAIYELSAMQIVPIDFSKGLITDIVEDNRNRFWVSSVKGLFLLQKQGNNTFSCETLSANGRNNTLNSDFIIRLFIDRSNNLFVSTYAGGVNILDLQQKAFHRLQYEPNVKNTLSENIIRAVADTPYGLWIGTNSMGLDYVDKKTGKYTSYRHTSSENTIGSNEIRTLLNTRDGSLWIGHTHGLDVLDIHSGTHGNFVHINRLTDFPEGEVTSLAKDCYGQIWAGTWNAGICRIRKKGNGVYENIILKESNPAVTAFSPSRVIALYADTIRPEVFYSSGKQLVRLLLDKKGEVTKSYVYQADEHKKNSMNSNFICAIRRENDSILWIGTLGGGISRITLREGDDYVAQSFSEQDGLNLKDIECLEIDAAGDIWGGGNYLVKYSAKTKRFQSYQLTNEQSISGYKIGGACMGEDGRIYMAGIRGIVYFYPEEIRDNLTDAVPYVSSLVVNNQPIEFSNKAELTYRQNNFKLYLTALHYANPQQCRFQYRLVGHNSGWQNVPSNSNAIYYANLPYKKYLLEVKATNNDGKWSSRVYSLPIEVRPPWWLSILAKCFYVLLALVVLVLAYVYLLRWATLKKKLEIKELQEQYDRQIQEIRYQFFTNISHELRNPLTLIGGTVEKMIQDNTWDRSYGKVLMRNVQRLMMLVDDVMDFKKVETGNPELKVQELDIYSFLRKVTDDFINLSYVKHRNFQVVIPPGVCNVCVDAEVLTKVLLNLLNNAFKYTKENCNIEIKILSEEEEYKPAYKYHYAIPNDYQSADNIRLYVRDTGIGISEDSIQDIFTRYYQIHDSELDPHLGTGIGLALVKSLVLLHKGSIFVSSERKKGTDFYLVIPCGFSDYSKDERLRNAEEHLPDRKVTDVEETSADLFQEDENSVIRVDGRPLLLLVEDDSEVRSFLVNILKKEYRIVQAGDGVDAIHQVEREIPDLIVSDLMMPNMDGNVLCRTIKEHVDYNQIPFILLTAKKSQEAQIAGTNAGADAFLSKPISMQLLKSTIKNLLGAHKRLKEYVSSNYLNSAIEETLQSKDKEFYDTLIGLIEEHLHDPDLDVTFLGEKIGYSRTRLYQKVKQITGLPIKELVRLLRLRKAVQLMVEKDLPISDILLRIGIQSQSYFTTIFKKEYGKTPAAFIRDLKNDEV